MSTRIYDALREIPNYRDPRGVIYKLADLHFMMICAILCGMRNAVEIVEYISYRIDDFRKIPDVKLDEDRQRQRLGNSKTNQTAFRRFLMALAKNPEHPKWTVSKFMICCQNRFDEMVNTLMKMGNTEKIASDSFFKEEYSCDCLIRFY